MLSGRSSALALLASLAALSSVVGCSQPGDGGESSAAAATGAVDASPLITIAANLPFQVKRMHPASGPILNAHWGAHGGPEATTSDPTSPTAAPIVTRWYIPTAPNAPAGQQPLKSALPSNLPTGHFMWNNDGFHDLSFGGAFSSYSAAGGNFVGEVLLYSKSYDTVKARGFVNGFYAGVEVPGASGSRLVYSGLSGVTAAAAPDTNESSLWSTDISPTAVGSQSSTKLFGWTGSSGPVAADADGNVFVAAYLSAPAGTTLPHTDEIYALSKKQALAVEPQTQSTVIDADTDGTSTLAVASVPASGKGWVFAKGWDSNTPKPIFARAYKVANDTVASDGDVIAEAIKVVDPTTSLSAFGDPKGNLWVAVEAAAGSWLIELEPKAP